MDDARLHDIPLFASLSKKERRTVAAVADELDVEEGRHLVDQGNRAYEFLVIERGTAEVTRDGEHVADLGPGDFIGEIGAVKRRERTASVVTTSPATVIVMTARDLRELDAAMPAVHAKLEEAIAQRDVVSG